VRSSIRAIIIINNLSSTIFAHVISLHRMVIVIKVNNRDILFLILRVLFFEESLTQDEDIFHETAASFPSWLATFELVSMVSRYSLWGKSEKFQLTHICINLCGRHGCPAQSGNT